jgi:hypothetical protein
MDDGCALNVSSRVIRPATGRGSRMIFGLACRRVERAACSDAAVYGNTPRPACESADYKRPSARAPLVSIPTTSARWCRGRRPRPGALLEVTGVRGSS